MDLSRILFMRVDYSDKLRIVFVRLFVTLFRYFFTEIRVENMFCIIVIWVGAGVTNSFSATAALKSFGFSGCRMNFY